MSAPTDAYVSSPDGTRIYAQALGDPSNPPIVFIHGFSLSSVIFDPIFDDPKWVERLYLIRYDTRGHGQSDKPIEDEFWTSDRIASDFDAVMQRFNVCRPYVLGWSLGATHLVDILSHHPPSYLRGLLNVNGCPHTGSILPRSITTTAAAAISPLLHPSDAEEFQSGALAFVEMLCNPDHPLPLALRRACLADIMLQPRAVARQLVVREQDASGLLCAVEGEDGGNGRNGRNGRNGGKGVWAWQNGLHDLNGLNGLNGSAGEEAEELPMLVLLGEKDTLTNLEEVARYMGSRRNCKIVVLPEAGHTPWIGHSGLFRETVLGWVEEHCEQRYVTTQQESSK
ncbi:hypothetical protein APHAL10511_001414 [Amanita phalloides]|nr:hypothetical protein APHAL10511_001414 [Amanita phalloides]